MKKRDKMRKSAAHALLEKRFQSEGRATTKANRREPTISVAEPYGSVNAAVSRSARKAIQKALGQL